MNYVAGGGGDKTGLLLLPSPFTVVEHLSSLCDELAPKTHRSPLWTRVVTSIKLFRVCEVLVLRRKSRHLLEKEVERTRKVALVASPSCPNPSERRDRVSRSVCWLPDSSHYREASPPDSSNSKSNSSNSSSLMFPVVVTQDDCRAHKQLFTYATGWDAVCFAIWWVKTVAEINSKV